MYMMQLFVKNQLELHKSCHRILMKYVYLSHLQILTFYIKVLRATTIKGRTVLLGHTLVEYPSILSLHRDDGQCLSVIPSHCVSGWRIIRVNRYIVSTPAIPHWQCLVLRDRLGLGGTGQCHSVPFLYVSGVERDARDGGGIWSRIKSIKTETYTYYSEWYPHVSSSLVIMVMPCSKISRRRLYMYMYSQVVLFFYHKSSWRP